MTLIADGPTATQLTTTDPRDGSAIATYPVAGPADVDRAVASAANVATWWREQGFAGRRKLLQAWKAEIASDARELASVISRETGKTPDDALLEVVLTLTHLDWASKNAGKVLRRRKVAAGLANYNQAASVGYEPFGVVGVIGPWNYPFYTPMGSIGYALSAGNVVVFKPSELTPATAKWIEEAWNRVAPDRPVLQVVVGDGATGEALASSAVDKVAFTGSPGTARKVMAAAARNLTPIVVEAGGKDAMIVTRQADLDAAVGFAVFGGMGNAGQTCAGVERVYVEAPVYDAFMQKLVASAARLQPGPEASASYGPMTLARQSEVISSQIAGALERGATAVLGGADSVKDGYVGPVILTGVPDDCAVVQEETFGPVLVVDLVKDVDEAIAKSNATEYGLSASVFTKDHHAGLEIAERLRCGAVSINSVLGFGGIPGLPFGGRGESGFGRIHGADGLREFSVAKSIAVQKSKAFIDLLTMDRSERDMHLAERMLHMLHAKGKKG
ncbi:aldehyde dehydrogenase [Agromyces luteolus]|uniref:Aldehyde dehydrogenase n=1 Tax=Agromyces luteolus TaxID=88373 RepID=A0A7C9LFD2_9MICO|nr:aldehyde dehydrogenase family protein [Agromyces luteolus]MUN06095.1 aldehyde dehydrogenase family protein [Agromyces luteolus]GLK28866.1 aldehyde dehydrogenase [Agromyces luteolus]